MSRAQIGLSLRSVCEEERVWECRVDWQTVHLPNPSPGQRQVTFGSEGTKSTWPSPRSTSQSSWLHAPTATT